VEMAEEKNEKRKKEKKLDEIESSINI